MIKKVLMIALVIVFALALTLSLGGCKDKGNDNGDDVAWEDDGDSGDIGDDGASGIDEGDGGLGIKEFYEDGEWPDNEYTKQLPKPDFPVVTSYLTENGFSTTFTDASLDGARAYGEKAQAAGFTINLDIYDYASLADALRNSPETSGISDEEIEAFLAENGQDASDNEETYNFKAENSDGYHLELIWWPADKEILLKITK